MTVRVKQEGVSFLLTDPDVIDMGDTGLFLRAPYVVESMPHNPKGVGDFAVRRAEVIETVNPTLAVAA